MPICSYSEEFHYDFHQCVLCPEGHYTTFEVLDCTPCSIHDGVDPSEMDERTLSHKFMCDNPEQFPPFETKVDFDRFITDKYFSMPLAEPVIADNLVAIIVWSSILLVCAVSCIRLRFLYLERVRIREEEAEAAAEQEAEFAERNKLKRMNQQLKRFELDVKANFSQKKNKNTLMFHQHMCSICFLTF